MKSVCTNENSVVLLSLNSEVIEAALSGTLEQFTSRYNLIDGIETIDGIYPVIDSDVISDKMLAKYDDRDYEHIYNHGKCPLKLRGNVIYARVFVKNKDVEGYVAFRIVSRCFVPQTGENDQPYRYNRNRFGEIEDAEGIYCNWHIEYKLGEMVEQVLSKPKGMMKLTTFAKRVDEIINTYKSLPKDSSSRQIRSLMKNLDSLIDYTEHLQEKLEEMKDELEQLE